MRTEEANVHAWLVGAYVRIAVASALDSGVDYPERPFGMEQEETEESWEASKLKMAGFAAKVDRKLQKTPNKKERDHRSSQ